MRGLLDRRRVGPATWFPPPTTAGEPGFLWKKAGGKNTRAERGSLRPGPTSLWSEIRESFFLYSETGLRPIFLTPVTARPPAGRAGGGGFADGKGCTAQSLPLGEGEGAPVRTLGRMRGRSCTQPFLVEKRGLPAVASTEFFFCSVGQAGRPLISHLR